MNETRCQAGHCPQFCTVIESTDIYPRAHICLRSPDILVSPVTGYGNYCGVVIRVYTKIGLSITHNVQTDTRSNPASYLMGIKGPFRAEKRIERKPTIQFHPLPKEIICGATPPFPRAFLGALNDPRLPLDPIPCKIWNSRNDAYENSHLLRNNTVYMGIGLQVQHCAMLLPPSKLSYDKQV